MKDVFWYESSEVKVPLGKALGSYLYNNTATVSWSQVQVILFAKMSIKKQICWDFLKKSLLILIINDLMFWQICHLPTADIYPKIVLNKLLLCCYLQDSKST